MTAATQVDDDVSALECFLTSALEEWLSTEVEAPAAPEDPPVPEAPPVPEDPPVPVDPLGELGGLLDSLSGLAGADWHGLGGRGGHEALDLVEHIGRQLAAVRAEVLSAVDGNGLWALAGSRTFASWVRHRTSTTAGAAARQVRESRALRDHLPLSAAALAAGEISEQHVSVLVREVTVTGRLREQLADEVMGEGFLVEQAKAMDAGMFTKLVKAWAIRVDPEAADRGWREADAKEELTIAPTTGGYHVAGWLGEASGQAVRTALSAHMGRKAQLDDRTPSQRRAAALVSLARQSLDIGRQGRSARVRPHLTVTAPLDTLRALAAATGSAVPPARPDTTEEPGPAPVVEDLEPVFGVDVDATLTATGGPLESTRPRATAPHTADGPAPFALSPEARAWVDDWRAGDEHVISTAIDYDMVRGTEPATLEDGSPVPPALLARLVCESALSRVVFGPDSTILDVGREKRIFPTNQATAIIARDRHCQYPGCDEPPGFGEIHHSLWWAKHHGPTSAAHGILLCWHHHDWVHAHQITITRTRDTWTFTDRNGRVITGPAG